MSHRVFLALAMLASLAMAACAGSGNGDDGGQADARFEPPPPDEDGDFISDEDEGTGDPDGDGIPNYLDDDSDGDGILDTIEGLADVDNDGTPNFLDLDSDQDCISDALEAGDTDPATPPFNSDDDTAPDAFDLDADNDGMPDYLEDINCNGIRDEDETDRINSDTDGDGVSDLIEIADRINGSDPLDPDKNPLVRGDFVFVMPYMEQSEPVRDDLDFSTNLKKVDVYFLLDRSGSMSGEIDSLRSNIVDVIDNLTCESAGGSGAEGSCIPDLFAGAGGIGYPGPSGEAFTNLINVQGNPAALSTALGADANPDPLRETGCDGQEDLGGNPPRPCDETTNLAMWSAITGEGSETVKNKVAANELVCAAHDGEDSGGDPTTVAFGDLMTNSYPDQTQCAGIYQDEEGNQVDGIGYPCFRPDALPVVVAATDESSQITVNCPQQSDIINASRAIGAKIVGLAGSGSGNNLLNEMRAISTMTGAVDIRNNNSPLLIEVTNEAQTASDVQDTITVLANGVPLEITAEVIDDPNNMTFSEAEAFIDRLETQQLGTEECSNMLTDKDTNNDEFPDTFEDITPGTPVCWSLLAKMNTTVEPIAEPQIFKATIRVMGNGITELDKRNVWFLVPPELVSKPID